MKLSDRERLRSLAAHQAEQAQTEKNRERTALFLRHNMLQGERPIIHIEVDTFAQEAITPRLVCEDPLARQWEYKLIHNCIHLEEFDDDWVVAPYFALTYDTHFDLFGHRIRETIDTRPDGTQMGHVFDHVIHDLGEDFDQVLSETKFGVDKETTARKFELAQEIFGDLLPVQLVTNGLVATPTQQVIHMMGMETMLYSIFDYPDEFKEMMDRIADAYIAYFRYLEKEGVLLPNHSYEHVCQGTRAFFAEEKQGPVKTTDLWGYMDSQETVGMSPDMFHEFIFPCYQKIAPLFGRLNYGCCEPVHQFWEDISTLPNLRKVSISPWCDEEVMAERLRGTDIIYHRKPSPNYLGVGEELDEEGFRAHIEKTVKTARGCHLEITQRDVYTVHRDMAKVRHYIGIIRDTIDKYWR